MPLTYRDVMDADLSTLLDAAKAWKGMSKRFGELKGNYKSHVGGLVESGSWTGQAAGAAGMSSKSTLHEYAAAEREAQSIGELLEHAHTTLTDLQNKVKNARDEAVEAKMKVDDGGFCTYDYTKLDEHKRQELSRNHVAREETERAWTKKIENAVKRVSEMDQDYEVALKTAVTDNDGKGDVDGFNSKAAGQVDEGTGQRAGYLYKKIANGKKLSTQENHQLNSLMKEHDGDPEFSRTLLDTAGPSGIIKAHNALDDSAYYDDKSHRKNYLGIDKSLANVMATATNVDSKHRPGSASAFASEWHKKLRRVGVKKYDLEFADKESEPGHGVRGYQSIVSLMDRSDRKYGSTFLHGLADDIRAAEDPSKGGDQDIWDMEGHFHGKKKDGIFDHSGTGRFANDPYDGVLGVMSKEPKTATSYFDGPDGDDRLEYLQKERNWDVVDTSRYETTGYSPHHVAGVDEDKDTRSGFGAALQAAMTGNEPGAGPPQDFMHHSHAERRVFEHVVNSYGETAKTHQTAMPDNIRQNMANALAYYPDDVHGLLSQRGDTYHAVRADQDIGGDTMTHFIRAAGQDGQAFRTIHDSQMSVISHQLGGLDHDDFSHDKGESSRANGVMDDSGKSMGSLDRIRADVLADHRDEEKSQHKWMQLYGYHATAAPLSRVPMVGGELDRLTYLGTAKWAEYADTETEDKTKEQLIDDYRTNGYPRLDDMVTARAGQVGVSDGDMHARDPQDPRVGPQLLSRAETAYQAGIGASEREMGEGE